MGNEAGLLGVWGRWALPVGVAGAVGCGAIAASTFVSGAPHVPQGVVFVLFFGVFPLHLGSVLVLRKAREKGEITTSVVRQLPLVAIPAFALFWLSGLSGMLMRSGATEVHDGRYYASDHGELTEIDKDEYDKRRAGLTRLFSSVPGGFYVVGAAVAYKARKDHLIDGSDDPTDISRPR